MNVFSTRFLTLLAACMLIAVAAQAQAPKIGPSIPQMPQDQIDAFQYPQTGFLVYNTTTRELQMNIGSPESPFWVAFNTSEAGGGDGDGDTLDDGRDEYRAPETPARDSRFTNGSAATFGQASSTTPATYFLYASVSGTEVTANETMAHSGATVWVVNKSVGEITFTDLFGQQHAIPSHTARQFVYADAGWISVSHSAAD